MGFACISPPYFIVEFGAYTSHHKRKLNGLLDLPHLSGLTDMF